MMTNVAATDCLQNTADVVTAKKVVIVNGGTEILALLDTVLAAGRYDVVFVESSEHAYSQIKRVQPNLVILCVRIDDADGFQVLSMLKLDEETSGIPVLTYTTEFAGQESEDEIPEPSETELFTAKPAVWMN
jgi:PleD family two-component response regulator